MRAYSDSSQEALLARGLLKDWRGQGFITEDQYLHMERETVCELRRTNIFLRAVLFLFTLFVVGAAAALFFFFLLPQGTSAPTAIFLLIFAALSYAAAELAVSHYNFYRYGIEEALAVCAVAFLCTGISAIPFPGFQVQDGTEFLVPAAGAVASLWIWHRFGFPYAFPAAMIFVVWLPGYWTSSHSAQHLIVAAIYTVALIAVAAVRSRYRSSYLDEGYSIVEACLWLGIYLAINLQLSSLSLLAQWRGGPRTLSEFPGAFYWTTWVLTWCLPLAVLWRGLRRKDRLVIAVGGIAAILTLVTNKPYLGWQRHTWDPMILGALLAGAALIIHRWLSAGPGGIRHGFTAKRLSDRDKRWMNAGSTAFGLMAPHTGVPQTTRPEVKFGGGDSAGGGATSDF
ncbi:MAG: hypothetical protein ABJC09_16265 [Terriglobia bacterium]